MTDIRFIPSSTITEAILDAYPRLSFTLDPALVSLYQEKLGSETDPQAREVLREMLENARIAENEHIPPCQDTGSQIFFVELGNRVVITDGTIDTAINNAVALATERYYLRRSVLIDPLFRRENSGDNTPAIIHLSHVEGEKIHILMGQKGGGAENMSQHYMLKPDATREDIILKVISAITDAGGKSCPPVIVGIGLGGDFELSALNAKRALFREIGSVHPDQDYALLESELLFRLNETQVGPQGLGGDTTALAVFIEKSACHIASLPLAINIQCHSHRHYSLWI